MAQLIFNADVRSFFEKTRAKITEVIEEGMRTAHGRLGGVTPYRSGRARASWNVVPGDIPRLDPAPWHPGNDMDAPPEIVAAAQAFYNPIYDREHAFKMPRGTVAITMANNVEYIELLNNGWSKQAPAAFFEFTIFQMDSYLMAAIAKVGTV